MPQNTRKIVLVLSGGFAKGSYQAGALTKLVQLGAEFHFMSGVSVGAINASMLATGQLERLTDLWRHSRQENVIQQRGWLAIGLQWVGYKIGILNPPLAFYDTQKLQRLIHDELIGKKVNIPFSVGKVDLGSGRYRDKRFEAGHQLGEEDCRVIYASTAIPVLFDPVRTENELWVDGGVRNITPLGKAIRQDPDLVVMITTEPFVGTEDEGEGYKDVDPDSIRSIDQAGIRSLDILLNEIFREDIKRFLSVNHLVRQHRRSLQDRGVEDPLTLTDLKGRPLKYFEPVLIDPKEALGDGMDFSEESFEYRFKAGARDAERAWENRSRPGEWIAGESPST
ncbi:MAG: patatin-like phospholipase family protein [Balneolaceae bacterium]